MLIFGGVMASKQMNIENWQVTYGSEKVGGGNHADFIVSNKYRGLEDA